MFDDSDLNLVYQDPLFVDKNNLNFQYLPDSPCIDAGNPDLFDLDGTTRDIGANIFYNILLGDCNQDSTISILDIVFVINNCILDSNSNCSCSDVNSDGTTNVLDVVNLINLVLEN